MSTAGSRRTSIVVLALAAVAGVCVASFPRASAQEKKVDRETKVREDRRRVESDGKWIYDDLPRAFETAAKAGKPVLVVFRCVPCEACAKLDEDVVDRDPIVQSIMERYVCVRVPKANGLDLATYQYDMDQSWAAFLMHADGTILARYGTRTHRTEADGDVTLAGFAKTLEAGLALHARFAEVKDSLAAKRGPAPVVKAPEEYPSLKGKFISKLDWEGKVVQSCIHCHMAGEALRRFHHDAGRAIPEDVLFPYPHPKLLGITIDPKSRARIASVEAGSQAAKDGFRAGDEFETLEGQPILSTADLQWVFHHAKAPAQLAAEVTRAGKKVLLPVTLAAGWRRAGDLTWRTSTWDLRRMFTGGMVLEPASDADRRKAGAAAGAMALRVKHVGQYGAHAAAKNAGFQVDDVVVAVDGKTSFATETELLVSLAERTKPGERTTWTIARGGRKSDIVLAIQ